MGRRHNGHSVRQLATALPGLRRTLRHVRPHLRPHRHLAVGGLAALVAEVGFRLLEPWPLKVVIDTIVQPGAAQRPGVMRLIALAAAALVGVVLLRALASYAMTVCFALAGTRAMTSVRAELFDHLQTLSLRFHHRTATGDLLTRLIGDVGRVQEVAVTAALPLLGNLAALAGMAVVMVLLDWQLALLTLVASRSSCWAAPARVHASPRPPDASGAARVSWPGRPGRPSGP